MLAPSFPTTVPMSVVYVQFGVSQMAEMLCDWEDNHSAKCITDQWHTQLWVHQPTRGRWSSHLCCVGVW